MLHIVLYQPEIPGNTGNIARTCVATGSTLHLIHPLGFSTDDSMLKRAGLDYWVYADVHEYQSIRELYDLYPDGTYYYIENFGTYMYTEVDYRRIEGDLFFVFGKETAGMPPDLLKEVQENCLRIPMSGKVRSLNLSNTVAVIMFEVLRQQGFPGLA